MHKSLSELTYWVSRLLLVETLTTYALRSLEVGLALTLLGVLICNWASVSAKSGWLAIGFLLISYIALVLAWFLMSRRCSVNIKRTWVGHRTKVWRVCEAISNLVPVIEPVRSRCTDKRVETILQIAADLSEHCSNLLVSTDEMEQVINRVEEAIHEADRALWANSFFSGVNQFTSADQKSVTTLPQTWELLSFILPPKTHRECFVPAYNDFLEKYTHARKFRTKWTRRCFAFAFTGLFLVMLAECFRLLIFSSTGKILLGMLPEFFQKWLRRQ